MTVCQEQQWRESWCLVGPERHEKADLIHYLIAREEADQLFRTNAISHLTSMMQIDTDFANHLVWHQNVLCQFVRIGFY
jgi:hypothetical protein